MKNSRRWRLGALAGAVALVGSLASLPAHALGLGRITVQSALGEPLRAEIDIAEISGEEAASLRAQVASADIFRASGLEYTAAVSDLQVSLQRRADGRPYLRLSSNRPVNEPFVDLVLEASWSSGRIVRDYTMLFDPPGLRQQGITQAPTAPILSRPAPPPPVTNLGSTPSSPPAVRPVPTTPPAPPSAPVARAPVAAPPVAAAPAAGSTGQVAVKAGDTAGRIAAANKPASVSLDQMLVALLQNNPDAFIGGNVNRLKSGAVLELPTTEQAGAIAPAEASRTIVAQSRNFNEFRRKLAEGVSTTQVGSAGREAGGQVQARVEDRAPAAATPDKLTLSKGAVQSRAAAEEKIAQERQAREASQRVAELSKNINDLNKLGVGAPAGGASAAAARAPGVTVPVPVPVPAAATPPVATPAATPAPVAAPATVPVAAAPSAATAASAAVAATSAASSAVATSTSSVPAVAASAPAEGASAPAAAPAEAAPAIASAPASAPTPVARPAAAPVPAPVEEPSLLDELMENPLILPGIAALLLLLAGLAVYKFRKRGSAAQVDSSFLESRLQPDSFFGASGGQRIDTNEGGATGSSLVYSPSQLDAAGDVDPVAEADVYLAYGRDLQAEEILKEAMRTSPTRVAIHSKLMEIYAKRRDAKAFEVVAVEAYNLTQGDGPEWAYIGEMGRELDPSNPMYQPGGQPSTAAPRVDSPESRAAAAGFGASTIPQSIEPSHKPSLEQPVDFDLDLDFSLGDEPAAPAVVKAPVPAPATATRPLASEATMPMTPAPEAMMQGLDMDFGTDTVAIKPPAGQPAASSVDPVLSASGLSFNAAPAAKPAPAPADNGMLEFDLGSLSLDLDSSTAGGAAAAAPSGNTDGPLETKFALAEEFRSLGDTDGARSLAEEVVAEATGSLKTRAQAFLTSLS